ncbi:UPF0301 protein Cpha266_0885-like [Hibiscus syriacus]|uniref:UPF0301 protein Cpha266_0885-like n=1 Tax=Hibiscus syriacus TaxID=106335 RepID=UPI001921AB19|nr:UPF0301 protein Cpha266_0885-like [Hibiscus syriacus]
MDRWAFPVKNTNTAASGAVALLSKANLIHGRPHSLKTWKIGVFGIRASIPCFSLPAACSLTIKAMAKKNDDHDSSSSEFPQLDMNTGWREFRARLYRNYEVEKTESDAHDQSGTSYGSKPLGKKWAHPLSVPENGCVLVATEKLDGVRTFERTVVLLLRSGTRHPLYGPFGLIINRPLHNNMNQMKPSSRELATIFADCSLLFGGPLEASLFLSRGEKTPKIPGFEEVFPGLFFGARESWDIAGDLVKIGELKSEDFKFFVGYAGWEMEQLLEEIESEYWYVAACSRDLIFGDTSDASSERLWVEILQEMGGHYSDLSRRPRKDM